jgi:glycosyltransferase involved in cell wall biosynthesis
MRGFFTEELERVIAGLALGDAVRLTGWLPRQELADLYLSAWAYVNPTLFEGFGMPVLEALAAGIPSACSSIEPLKSVAGDAALLFDPTDEKGMLDALERIALDEALRARLTVAGPQRAAQFSWRKTAEATLELLVKAAQSTC